MKGGVQLHKSLIAFFRSWQFPMAVQILAEGSSLSKAIKTVQQLLTRTDFDAVFAADDSLAIGAGKAIVAEGRPPVPLVGFNNTVLSRCVTPELSSVDNRMKQQCSLTVQTLLSVMNGDHPSSCVTIDACIVEREGL
jgi:LacI family transcriptional regulator/LacI family asc operon transcriptional repressor